MTATRKQLMEQLERSGIPEAARRKREVKMFPRSQAPRDVDYNQAAVELSDGFDGIYSTEQRAKIVRRAWVIMMDRHKREMGVN